MRPKFFSCFLPRLRTFSQNGCEWFWTSFLNLDSSTDHQGIDAMELESRAPFANANSSHPAPGTPPLESLDLSRALGFSKTPASAFQQLSPTPLSYPSPDRQTSVQDSLNDLAQNILHAKKMVAELNSQLNSMKQAFESQSPLAIDETKPPVWPEKSSPPFSAEPEDAGCHASTLETPIPMEPCDNFPTDPVRGLAISRPRALAVLQSKLHLRMTLTPTIQACRFRKICNSHNPKPKSRARQIAHARTHLRSK